MNVLAGEEVCHPSSTSDEDSSYHLLPFDRLKVGERKEESERRDKDEVIPLVGQWSSIPAIGICSDAVHLAAVYRIEVAITVGAVGDGESDEQKRGQETIQTAISKKTSRAYCPLKKGSVPLVIVPVKVTESEAASSIYLELRSNTP